MARRRLARSSALLVVLAACADDPVAVPVDAAIVGRWETVAESLSPQGSWQRSLVVTRDGQLTQSGTSYGVYPGQSAGDVSAVTALHAHIDPIAGGFVVRPDSVVTSDRFFGATHREVDREPARVADPTRYTIDGDVLVLSYYTYPADAPVLTTETLRRVH